MRNLFALLLILLVSCGGSGPGNGGSQTPGVSADGTSGNGSQSNSTKDPAQEALDKEKERAEKEAAGKNIPGILPPKVSIGSGVYSPGISVTLTPGTSDSKVFYTLDGSSPDGGGGKAATGGITLNASVVLKAAAQGKEGQWSSVLVQDYTLGEVCVEAGTQGNGTRSAPFGTLAQAIEKAQSLKIPLIKTGAALPVENLVITKKVNISGGWAKGFARKSGARTVLAGGTMAGNDKKTPGYALKLTGAGTQGSRFELMDITGPLSPFSTAVLFDNQGAGTFISCSFTGGDGDFSYGIQSVSGSSPDFSFCRFDGGKGSSSFGVSVEGAQAVIRSCVSSAGSGTVAGGGALVNNGSLYAYSCVLSGNSAYNSYGIAAYNMSDSHIEGCTLWGGRGQEAMAMFVSLGNPRLISDILAAEGVKVSYGYYDNYGNSMPSRFSNLVFTGCATGIYFDVERNAPYTKVSAEGILTGNDGRPLAGVNAEASSKETFALGPGPAFATPAGAPATVKTGGLVSTAYPYDVNGSPRTPPWSIGAYEKD